MEIADSEDEDGDTSDLPDLEKVIRDSLTARGMSPVPSPPKKRQRTGTTTTAIAQNTLHKPFRSPFKTPLKPRSQPSGTRLLQSSNPSSTTTAHPLTPPPTLPLTPTTTTPATTALPNTKSPIQSTGPGCPLPSPPAPSSIRLDQLQKHHTHLLNTHASLRARLDTTTQALEIEASATDAELACLSRKWRDGSRGAAETVYAVMKEQVEGCGGMKAMKRRGEEERGEAKSGWRCGDGGGRLGGEEEEEEDNGFREQNRIEGLEKGDGDDDDYDDDDEGFTMEVMLKSLGIPLDAIGYDRDQQRWVE